MAKTEVILISNVVGLGAESDRLKVAAGYARNYLFPQGLAVPLNAANKKRIESLQKRRAEREAHEYNAMSELAKSLAKLVCTIKVKTGDDGKLFGSVTAGTISDELKHQFDIALEKRKIHLDHPIRALGEYDVVMRLHQQVPSTLKVRVESSNPLPPAAETPAEPARAEAPRRDYRGKGGKAAAAETAPKAEAAGKPAKGAKPDKAEKPAKGAKAAKPAKE